MIVPTRRWLLVAALLSLTALAGQFTGAGGTILLVVDLLWIVALLIDAWRSWDLSIAALEVTRQAPPAFSAGREAQVRYRWGNPLARRLTLDVREEFPGELATATAETRSLSIPAGGSAFEEITVRAVRRGRAVGGRLHLRIPGPWGLAARHARRELPWKATVFPDLTPAAIRALPTQAQRRREVGLRNVRRLGEGRVFESLREWVPGDDTRTIDWKATAKRGKAMARQYEDERRQQVLIVIDAGRMLTAEIEGKARLEFVIDAALQLAHSAIEHDDNVGLLVFADEVQHFIAPGRGRAALRRILEALATTSGRLVEPNYPAAFAYLAAHNRKRALTVLFTDVIDRTASDAMLGHIGTLRPRHVPLAVALRNPELDLLATLRPRSTEAAFERAAAEELLQAREAALTDMRSRGVLILDVPPSGAAVAVVEQYTKLKRRGMI
jgi:uncharacterized protein (DUF58 family)